MIIVTEDELEHEALIFITKTGETHKFQKLEDLLNFRKKFYGK